MTCAENKAAASIYIVPIKNTSSDVFLIGQVSLAKEHGK
jgi:hypothetical protein